MRRLVTTAALFGVLAFSANAQEGRFQLERSGDGFLRLDRQTGEISRCTDQDGQAVCRTSADERATLIGEIERLDEKVDALELRIAALEAGQPSASGKMPSEQEFEQSLGFMERFVRRFFGIIQDLEKQFGTEQPQEPQPERT